LRASKKLGAQVDLALQALIAAVRGDNQAT
jgi:hypothetical protein